MQPEGPEQVHRGPQSTLLSLHTQYFFSQPLRQLHPFTCRSEPGSSISDCLTLGAKARGSRLSTVSRALRTASLARLSLRQFLQVQLGPQAAVLAKHGQ